MTRASSTATFARMSQTRRSGTGSGYPQWMRTLEEKYQKLHKKITENTGAARFTNCVGRSVYDPKLSHALSKYKEITNPKCVPRIQSSKDSPINTNIETTELQEGQDKENLQNQYLDKSDTIYLDSESVKNCENIKEKRVESRERSIDCEQDRFETDSAKSRDSKCESAILREDGIKLDIDVSSENKQTSVSCDENSGTDKTHSNEYTNHISFDKSKSQHECDDDKLDPDKHLRRNLKTSVSRTSKVTSKSCPAKFTAQSIRPGQRQLLAARSKSANRLTRMFTPMSEEAKHAITETIHEMNTASTGRITDRSDIKFIPSRGRTCVKSWAAPKKAKSSYNARTVLESASQCLNAMKVDRGKSTGKYLNNQVELCKSSVESSQDGEDRMESRLPDIQSGSARDRGTGRSQSYRIPGIGKYNITHDDPVFEITPPGFDSRYNDVANLEERESETPPPDIRQRAIDKCSEWLVKYNK